MNILIIGCGRLGARLANVLSSQNHDISVIGSEESINEYLDDEFDGISIPGSPIDADVMKSAGIEGCDYVICATESDNKNIMAAQIIKNKFNIKNVFVRVLDPVKCELYANLGLLTISPTSIVFKAIYSKIFNSETDKILNLGKSSANITTIPYNKWMKGKTFSDVEFINNHKLIGFLNEDNILTLYTKDKEKNKIEKNNKLIYIAILT